MILRIRIGTTKLPVLDRQCDERWHKHIDTDAAINNGISIFEKKK
jgi:hypothetical protein